MNLRPATPRELEALSVVLGEFRTHWRSIRPPFVCPFDGVGADIRALDYLDYEAIPGPASGQAGAALVWGNVVATQLPFGWFFDDHLGGLVLRSTKGPELTIWPFGRVCESQRSRETQFDKYRRLTEWVVLQSLGLHIWNRTTGPVSLLFSKVRNSDWQAPSNIRYRVFGNSGATSGRVTLPESGENRGGTLADYGERPHAKPLAVREHDDEP